MIGTDRIVTLYREARREENRLGAHYEWCDDPRCYPIDDERRSALRAVIVALRATYNAYRADR